MTPCATEENRPDVRLPIGSCTMLGDRTIPSSGVLSPSGCNSITKENGKNRCFLLLTGDQAQPHLEFDRLKSIALHKQPRKQPQFENDKRSSLWPWQQGKRSKQWHTGDEKPNNSCRWSYSSSLPSCGTERWRQTAYAISTASSW